MNHRIHFTLPFFVLLIGFNAASQSEDGKDSLTASTNICECIEGKIEVVKKIFALIDSVKTTPETNDAVYSEECIRLERSLYLLENERPRTLEVLPENTDCENHEAWAQLKSDFELIYRINESLYPERDCGPLKRSE